MPRYIRPTSLCTFFTQASKVAECHGSIELTSMPELPVTAKISIRCTDTNVTIVETTVKFLTKHNANIRYVAPVCFSGNHKIILTLDRVGIFYREDIRISTA